jgi:hypothetical protein
MFIFLVSYWLNVYLCPVFRGHWSKFRCTWRTGGVTVSTSLIAAGEIRQYLLDKIANLPPHPNTSRAISATTGDWLDKIGRHLLSTLATVQYKCQ